MAFSTSITVSGEQVTASVPRGTKAWRLANSVFIPLGYAHSEAWLLMPRKALARLDRNGFHTIVWEQTGDRATTLTMPRWSLLKADRLLLGGPSDPNSLYLCQFVDSRYFAALNSSTGPVRANLRSFAQADDYLKIGNSKKKMTWDELVKSLWLSCGIGAYSGLPNNLPLDGVPENSYFIALNGWRALNAVLEQLDCAVAHDPVLGSYYIVQLGGQQNFSVTDPSLQWDAQPLRTDKTIAANLWVHFYYHHKAYGQERDTEIDANILTEGASDIVTLTSGIEGATGTKVLWDDLSWVFDEKGKSVNTGAVYTRAQNRVKRYVARNTVVPRHQIISGLTAAYQPGGQIRAVLFRNWDDGESPIGGTVTEYLADSGLVSGFKGMNNEVTAWTDKELYTPEQEAYAPPDYGRHTAPNFPRLSNLVQIHHEKESPGDDDIAAAATVSPNEEGFHRGRVRRWVHDAMETLETCWIRFVDNHDVDAGQVDAVQDEFYGPARLSGVKTTKEYTSGKNETLPLYLVKLGAVVDGVRFINDSGYEVPPHGVMEVVDHHYDDELTHIIRPTARRERIYLVNRETPVPDGEEGLGDWGFDKPIKVLCEQVGTSYDEYDGVINDNKRCFGVAPVANYWHLSDFNHDAYNDQYREAFAFKLQPMGSWSDVDYPYEYGWDNGSIDTASGFYGIQQLEVPELSQTFPLDTVLQGSVDVIPSSFTQLKIADDFIDNDFPRIGVRTRTPGGSYSYQFDLTRNGVYRVELQFTISFAENTYNTLFTSTATSTENPGSHAHTYDKIKSGALQPSRVKIAANFGSYCKAIVGSKPSPLNKLDLFNEQFFYVNSNAAAYERHFTRYVSFEVVADMSSGDFLLFPVFANFGLSICHVTSNSTTAKLDQRDVAGDFFGGGDNALTSLTYQPSYIKITRLRERPQIGN